MDGRQNQAACPPEGLWAGPGAPTRLPKLSRKPLPADWKNRHGAQIASRPRGRGGTVFIRLPPSRLGNNARLVPHKLRPGQSAGRAASQKINALASHARQFWAAQGQTRGRRGADAGHSKHSWAWGPSSTAQRGRPWALDTPGAQPVGSRRGDSECHLSPEERLPTHTHLETLRGFCCGIWGGAEVTGPRRPWEFWALKVATELACSLKAQQDRGHGPGGRQPAPGSGGGGDTKPGLGVPAGLAQFRGGGGSEARRKALSCGDTHSWAPGQGAPENQGGGTRGGLLGPLRPTRGR